MIDEENKEKVASVFLHHDMTDPDNVSAFKRRGERFQKILKSDKRKFFLMCKLIQSNSAAKKAQDTGNQHFQDMFDALMKKNVTKHSTF